MAHLIYQTAFIGDLLLSTPLIREFRKLYPNDKVVLACRKGAGQIFLAEGWVDELVEIDKSSRTSWREFSKKLKSYNFDTIVCAHESVRTHLLMLQLKAQKKIGYLKWWNPFVFHERVQRPMRWPEALRLLSLLQPLSSVWRSRFNDLPSGLENLREQKSVKMWPAAIPEWASMTLSPNSETNLLTQTRPVVFMSPGSVWATKKWKEEHFAKLAIQLLDRGYLVTLTGSPSEQDICERIELAVKSPNLRNICGKTSLQEMVKLFQRADWVIANDSSPIHLAALAGARTVALFGPTTLSLGYRPWNDKARVAQIPLPCRPCGAHGHDRCPIGTHQCMQDLSVETVLDLITSETS